MALHAKLSASSAHCWMNCPGAIKAQEPFPDKGSTYADEGTAAHMLASRCLNEEVDAWHYLAESVDIDMRDSLCIFTPTDEDLADKARRIFEIDDEMVNSVQEYLDLVREHLYETEGATLFVEQRVEFSDWVNEGFGTADAIVVAPGTLKIFDLKYGRGVAVVAKENEQAQLYALGVLQEFEFLGLIEGIDEVTLYISQPRKNGTNDWDVSVTDLLKFGERVKECAIAAEAEDAPRVPGEKQCQWCRAKSDCKELADASMEELVGEFAEWEAQMQDDEFELDDPDLIGDNLRLAIMDKAPLIKKFLGAIEDRIFEETADGKHEGRYKMVEGRSNRRWKDKEAALKALKRATSAAQASKSEIISPTAAEKLLGKGHSLLAKHVVKPIGKSTLARWDDKRPEVGFRDAEFDGQ